MRFNLDPTWSKVLIIAVLIFLEGALTPALTELTAGKMPSNMEWLAFILTAVLQLVTFLVTFLETGTVPLAPAPPKAPSPGP